MGLNSPDLGPSPADGLTPLLSQGILFAFPRERLDRQSAAHGLNRLPCHEFA